MTRRNCILFALFSLTSASATSQTVSFPFKFELGGSAWYQNTYREFVYPFSYNNHQNHRERDLVLNPVVGYFFTEDLELSGDLWYHFYWRTAYTRQESAGQVYQSDYHWLNHDLSVRIAIRYNLHVSRALVPFVGVSSGVKWAKYGSSQSDNRVEYSNWTSPSYLVPSALLGSRFFVADNWAVLLQLDYRGFGKDERSDDVRARSYSVTIGLVTFL